MKKGYIITPEKKKFLFSRPKIFTFETGNELYVFSNQKKIKKYNVDLIPKYIPKINDNIAIKIAKQIIKENNIKNITISFDNPMDYLSLIHSLIEQKISFSILYSDITDLVTDYFLEKYGIPVSITTNPNSELLLYFGGSIPKLSEKTMLFDFTEKLALKKIIVKEYKIKNIDFPFKINNLPLLLAVLELSKKNIEDICLHYLTD